MAAALNAALALCPRLFLVRVWDDVSSLAVSREGGDGRRSARGLGACRSRARRLDLLELGTLAAESLEGTRLAPRASASACTRGTNEVSKSFDGGFCSTAESCEFEGERDFVRNLAARASHDVSSGSAVLFS